MEDKNANDFPHEYMRVVLFSLAMHLQIFTYVAMHRQGVIYVVIHIAKNIWMSSHSVGEYTLADQLLKYKISLGKI